MKKRCAMCKLKMFEYNEHANSEQKTKMGRRGQRRA